MTTPAGHLAVLAFHGVDASDTSDPLTVTPVMLAAMLTGLRCAGARLVGLTAALADPVGAVALTFDDGYADFAAALPALEAADAAATLYVPSRHVGGTSGWLADRRPLLGTAELRDLVGTGRVELGCHGATHAPLDTLSPALLGAETTEARRDLESWVGAAVVSFAYPHGYWHRPSRDAVERAGFTNACVLGHGLHRVGSDPFTVRRLLVSNADTPATLQRRMASTRPTLRRIATTGLNRPWRSVRKVRQAVGA